MWEIVGSAIALLSLLVSYFIHKAKKKSPRRKILDQIDRETKRRQKLKNDKKRLAASDWSRIHRIRALLRTKSDRDT